MKIFVVFVALVAGTSAGVLAQSAGVIPKFLVDNGFTMFADLIGKAGLNEFLSGPGPFTVFAPINTAFAELGIKVMKNLSSDPQFLKCVINHHVVAGKVPSTDFKNELVLNSTDGSPLRINFYKNGSTVFPTVDGDMILKADIPAGNGIIHGIDTLMVEIPRGGVVSALQTDEENRFTTLVIAIEVANLVDTLENGGPFTLFAPTNKAFKALPKGALKSLLANPEELKKLLLGHVISGTFYTAGIQSGTVTTLRGSNATIEVDEDYMEIQSTDMVDSDIYAVNGVIHVIQEII